MRSQNRGHKRAHGSSSAWRLAERQVPGPSKRGMLLAPSPTVAMGWSGPDQRKSPRIAVLMRVRGELTEVSTPVVIHDLSKTGFAVVSRLAFPPGDTLDFRLEGGGEPPVAVTARAVHSRAFGASPHIHLSGFEFVPGPLTGRIPQAAIDRLFDALRFPARLLNTA